ncbi:MAG: SDR family oxidoreductase [Clostridiales bacterium]|nr:SDR family oxidoreductase [Clostridiales bacterium]
MDNQKHCLITGGSRGIGAATAYRFAKEGYRITFFYRRDDESAQYTLERIRRISAYCQAMKVDIRDFASVRQAVHKAEEEFGPIDVLVNNAGISRIALFTETSEDQWNDMLSTNIGGLYNLTQSVLPSMLHRHEGSIINISSMWGVVGASCEVAYSTSKAAIIGFTKALAQEVGPSHIRVNCVAPGVIDTEMNAELDDETRDTLSDNTPLCRIGSPEEVADAVYFLASENASFITGQILGVNGGYIT